MTVDCERTGGIFSHGKYHKFLSDNLHLLLENEQ